MNDNLTHPLASTVGHLAERATDKADQALQSTRHMANGALDTLKDSVDQVRDQVPSALVRSAAEVENLARRGIERAKETSAAVKDQAQRASDRTVSYIQDEPLKAVLIAAAAGATLAVLMGWLSRSRNYPANGTRN